MNREIKEMQRAKNFELSKRMEAMWDSDMKTISFPFDIEKASRRRWVPHKLILKAIGFVLWITGRLK